MRKIVPRRFNWPSKTLAVIMCVFLSYLLFGTGPVHALDPNKRLTQYMHTSWRIQDGPCRRLVLAIAQTSDGFFWFSSDSQGMYRFDGVRFLPWTLPPNDKTINAIVKVYGDHAWWAMGTR